MIERVMLIALLVPAVAAAQTKPVPRPADFGKWESPGPAVLSPDGSWLAYGVNRVNEENELRLRRIGRDSTITIPMASGAAFTPDSKWLAYTIGVAPAVRERLERERKPIRNAVGFRNLSTLAADSLVEAASFRFSGDGRFLAVRRYPAEGKRVADVIVQNLETGERMTFGNVSEYAWAERKALLALTIETENATGNAAQLYDASAGVLRVLHSSPSIYRGLSWRTKSTDLALLRSRTDKEFSDTTHVAMAWTALDTKNGAAFTVDQTAFPEMRISEARQPQWARDRQIIFLGLRPRARAAPTAAKASGPAEKVSDVQVWHSKDVRLVRAQEVQDQADTRATFLSAWHLANNQLVKLGTDLLEPVTVLDGANFATESDRKPYAWGQMFGRPYRDIYVTGVDDGKRVRALEKVRYYSGGSPGGNMLVWFDGKDWWSHNLANDARANLTAKVQADFIDRDYDTPTDLAPSTGFGGFVKGNQAVLLYDKYDIWQVALDGSGGKKLTNGAPEQIIYRYLRTRTEDEGVDLSRPVYLTMLGDRSKKYGFARLAPGKTPETLIFNDERVTRLIRADSADVFAYTREDYDDAPDWFAGDMATAKQVSELNRFEKEYALGKSELVDFTSATGKPLQAGLYYPANYDPSRKYPMIVYTYELLSQGVHNYVVPSERSYYNKSVWTANGYFVLEPDIVFRAREPGVSTLDAVVPAVRAIIARGLVDSTRVGHIGHSWGGYEAAFLPTRTRIFAASVAGAAITNMLSFNGAVHWSGGGAEYDHWETGQARMEVPPWEDLEAYLRNSPIAKVHELKSPVLVMTGDADGTVEWHQSMEYYQSARRAGRNDVVMLLYPGEDHGLRKKENQIDYHRRILQWFGHYLKGEPAARWITEGVTWQERKAILDANK